MRLDNVMDRKKSNKKRVILSIITDILLFLALLLYFCWFHHVRVMLGSGETSEVVPTESVISKPSVTPTNTATPSPTPEADVSVTPSQGPTSTPTPTPECDINGVPYDFSGDFGEKFGKMFLGDERVMIDDTSYRSHDVYIKMSSFDGMYSQRTSKTGEKFADAHTVWYAFDVYVRNIENLFVNYKNGTTNFSKLFEDTSFGQAVAAISGDLFYGYNKAKPVIVRNGSVIRKADYITDDICVLYWDGTMEIETHDTYDWNRIKERAPYQVWSFGPSLLDENGQPKLNADVDVWRKNPRSVLGYVEPGHYVLIAILGYRDEAQKAENGVGTNLEATAQIAADLGCKLAYNLDGGASVYAGYRGIQLFDVKNSNGSIRRISDIICIGESLTGGGQ